MFYEEKIPWIKNTPLGIRVRNIEFVPTHMHENIVEIILCLKGSVKISYGFEEFTLLEGEFISVDKDAHFLYEGEDDNICVSFYIDLEWFSEKYPFLTSLLFACEATQESDKPYPTYHHKQLKGMLIAILYYISNHKKYDGDFQDAIIRGAERIVDIMIDHFDIVYYYNPDLRMKAELMERNRNMMVYFQAHYTEKITLDSVANEFNLTKAYISEFLRTYEIGFRKSLSYIRANKSEKLLLATDMNITDISEACGFSDPKYYYSAFKEWYKCTPRKFRQIYRNRMSAEGSEWERSLSEVVEPLNGMILKHYLDLFLF